MQYIENATLLRAPPIKVWALLTNLNGHQEWEPLVQLSGAAAIGATVNYSVQLGHMRKAFHSTATITLFKKPEEFGWSVGFKHVLRFQDTYRISPHPTGTRLLHQLHFVGLLARPWCWLMKRSMLASLIIIDRSFERHIEELLAGKGAGLSKNRTSGQVRNHPTSRRKWRARS